MKKIMISIALLLLVGCSSNEEYKQQTSGEFNPQTEDHTPQQGNYIPQIGEPVQTPTSTGPQKDFSSLEDIVVDFDLSTMPANLSYSLAIHMLSEYDTYEDKTIKMRGHYASVFIADYGVTVHLVMLLDELACCQGFLEFVLPEGEQYPEEGEEIMITGVYVMYEDEMGIFPVIEVDKIL
ncbi:MAG: hypothetical protein R3Y07_10870 [Eubacteriales bacterium]